MHGTTRSTVCRKGSRSQGLKTILAYRIPQIEYFAGIQTHRKSNLDRRISIAVHLMARIKYEKPSSSLFKQLNPFSNKNWY